MRRASLALCLLVAGCSGTTAGTTIPPSTAPAPDALPPHEYADLLPILQPLVEPYGYRVSRAALVDPTTYETTPDGGHLAVYLEPTRGIPMGEVADLIAPLSGELIPLVFRLWPGLTSFDFCQETPDWTGEGDPPSLTIITVSGASVEGIPWSDTDLEDMIRIGRETIGFTVWAVSDVRDTTVWKDAGGL